MKRKKNFIQKLLVSYLIIAMIPALGFFAVIMVNKYKEAEKNAQLKVRSAAQTISAQVDGIYSDMSFISIDLLSRGDFFQTTKKLYYNSKTPQAQREYYRILVDHMTTYSLAKSIYQVIFFNPEGYFISNYHYNIDYHYGSRIDPQLIESLPWIEDVQKKSGEELMLPVQKNAFFEHDTEVMGLGRAIRDPGTIIGYIVVQADMARLDYLFENANQIRAGVRIVSDGRVIYQDSLFEDGKKELIYASVTSASSGITVEVAKDKTDIYAGVLEELCVLGIQALVLLTLMALCMVFYSNKLSKPLAALTGQMQKLTLDNLDAETNIRIYHDYTEIEYLSKAFSDMRNRLNSMINETIVSKSIQMEERFRALQSQINPHFIYNTLNVIGIMGQESGEARINDACIKLSELLRYSISDPYSNTTFEAEFANIRSYLELLKLRYEHKLEYRIQLDESLKEMELPKLVIQPFVENAIEHAFDKNHKTIEVTIDGKTDGENWIIVISDNGKGFEKEKLEQLLSEVEQFLENDYDRTRNQSRPFQLGVRNTIARLALYYEGFSYQFFNQEKGGAQVVLSSKRKKRMVKNASIQGDNSGR